MCVRTYKCEDYCVYVGSAYHNLNGLTLITEVLNLISDDQKLKCLLLYRERRSKKLVYQAIYIY